MCCVHAPRPPLGSQPPLSRPGPLPPPRPPTTTPPPPPLPPPPTHLTPGAPPRSHPPFPPAPSDSARAVLVSMVKQLGADYLPFVCEVLQSGGWQGRRCWGARAQQAGQSAWVGPGHNHLQGCRLPHRAACLPRLGPCGLAPHSYRALRAAAPPCVLQPALLRATQHMCWGTQCTRWWRLWWRSASRAASTTRCCLSCRSWRQARPC